MFNGDDPTVVIKMLKDLRSGTEAYKRTNSIPLRLSGDPCPTKVIQDEECRLSPKRSRFDESLNSTSADAVPKSPWEWRRLKGEVISLRTRLTHQEKTVEQLHKLRREMEQIFDKEKHLLEMQIEQGKQVINQLELRIDVGRRSLQETRESKARIERDSFETKSRLEQEIAALQEENAELMKELRELSETKLDDQNERENAEFTEMEMQLKAAEARVVELEESLKESRACQRKLELDNVELQNLRNKVEKLESERSLWEEGKQLVSRASRVSDLERELNLAKETIINLRESVKGKLILEEQMSTLSQRVERTEQLEKMVSELQVKCAELSDRLVEYESIGFSGSPAALKCELNRLQQNEVILSAENGQLCSNLNASERECKKLQEKCNESDKYIAEKTTALERLTRLISRTQKKMLLVTRERDSYRQQLDLYEKEITVADCNNMIAERISPLERALEGYRELVTRLEADLETADVGKQRDECRRLREENEKLKNEMEHRILKGDFNCNARVLHFKMNPKVIAEQQAEEKQKALLREVEELRSKVSYSAGTGTTGTSSIHNQEIAEVKQAYEIKITRLKEAFKISSQEFRQACYQLFAWRVDRTKEGMYKLSSQYAESPNDFLFFQIDNDGVNLLETPYSATLDTLIDRYLKVQRSVPMFLNALQADLFEQQTATDLYTDL